LLQPTFSYKVRGAFNAVARVLEAGGERQPLVTASAGNHGRALAFAASRAGVPLIVYVPRNAPRTKLQAIEALGADVRLCADYDEAERQAKAYGASGRAEFISAYTHPDVIAGAGTVGLEILEDRPDVDCIVVPIGGGGLISGVAVAVSEMSPRTAVTGVEVEQSSPFTQSLAAGHIVEIAVGPTLADGLAGNLDPDTLTFEIVRTRVGRIVLVSEADLREAIAGLARHERLITEGAGATAAAAVLTRRLDAGQRVAVVVSGANIDLDVFRAII
jgi:threonine dehydratase